MREVDRTREFHTLTERQVHQWADELVRLQRQAYQIEVALIGDIRIPQLTESAQELLDCGLHWIVCLHPGQIIGAVAYSRLDGTTLDIERLIVSPEHHRQGIARELIHRLPPGAKVVSTGKQNHPARQLYEALGFAHDNDYEVLPGLWLSKYSYAMACAANRLASFHHERMTTCVWATEHPIAHTQRHCAQYAAIAALTYAARPGSTSS